MSNDLTNQKIKDTYGKVVQYVSGSFYDLLGNVIPSASLSASYATTASYAISSSYEINYETSSSYADTASYVITAQTASFYGGNVTSASYASTSSYALLTPNPDYKIVSSSYTLTLSDSNIEVLTLGVTQSLPTAIGNIGKEYSIINSSTGSIMILASGSEHIGNKFIQNSSSLTIGMEDAPRLISNNSQWRIK